MGSGESNKKTTNEGLSGNGNKNGGIPEPLTRRVNPGAEQRQRRNDIDKLSQKDIEGAAGRLNANQYALLNQQQQKWYTDATKALNEKTRNEEENKKVSIQPTEETKKTEIQLDPEYKKEVNKLVSQIRAMRARGAQLTDDKITQKLVDIAGYDYDEGGLWDGLNEYMYNKGRTGGWRFDSASEVKDFIDSIEKRLGISLSPTEADRNRARPKSNK